MSPESILLLEQSILKVPVEMMRKGHRIATKTSDKDISIIDSSLKKIRTRGSGRADKLKAVEGALSRLHGLHARVRLVRRASTPPLTFGLLRS